MEGKDQPVDFKRVLSHTIVRKNKKIIILKIFFNYFKIFKANVLIRNEKPLNGSEIVQTVEKILQRKEFSECSSDYLSQIK